MMIASLELAQHMVDVASDKLGEDVVLLDLRPLSAFTDFFVVVGTESSRQINAIADAIEEELVKDDVKPLHREGTPESGWVLLDLGPVIVHLFDQERRAFYGLERVWQQAVPLIRIQ
ncbi:MAG: ribosome silencing factor [Dehalococcoidia bacterium]|nr:ribosome silencing factor [Dehalococcoidia bacterium]